ncbi:MAG: hypothetical protein K2H29_07320 [Oscillospiraceae bacterium]|nr:hypothetical protein [Oscillospiraceae bacterium]
MRKKIKCHKKSGHKEQMNLREILLLITAALGFVKMVSEIIQDWLG